MNTLAVPWKDPCEAKVEQAGHGPSLLGPRMPAIIAKRNEALFVAVPGEVIACEEVPVAE